MNHRFRPITIMASATATESTPVSWTYDLKRATPDILRAFSLMFHDPQSDELQALLKKSNLTNKKWKAGEHVYSILKYNAGALKCDELQTIGLLRSVVLDQHGKIIAYSPPKCVVPSADELNGRFSDDNIIVEEFVEGTMVNVFTIGPTARMKARTGKLQPKAAWVQKSCFIQCSRSQHQHRQHQQRHKSNHPRRHKTRHKSHRPQRKRSAPCFWSA
jgi:hypothetical protein